MLLLARGACIETDACRFTCDESWLLLARGACIETMNNEKLLFPFGCSSQEEHVLKQKAFCSTLQRNCCSSQEEHVLKQESGLFKNIIPGCSSQEEHVLKHAADLDFREAELLLLARGACIETGIRPATDARLLVAPRKRSMY